MAENLRIAVIGAGMGGLTAALSLAQAGHNNISVYESASNLGFVGAGIQLAPNMARILDRLGCWQAIEADAVQCANTSIREASSDNELGYVDLGHVRDKFGYPHMVGHRASLANALCQSCQKEPGITFKFGSIVSAARFGATPTFRVTPARGGEDDGAYDVECDVLLGADGIKSPTRVAMLQDLGITASVRDSGQAAYRIMLTRAQMQHDAALVRLLDANTVTRWVGEQRHIIAYPIHRHQIYNISTAQPDTHFAGAPDAQYTTKGSKAAMLNVYRDFCPTVHKLLNSVPDDDNDAGAGAAGAVVEWKLRVHDPLPTWVHASTALLGDACHASLPHMAQGAAQAVEDGAVLGVVLAPARLADGQPAAIARALRVYERVRKPRAEALVALAAENGRMMHLGAGSAREERDQAFAAARAGEGRVPDRWADAGVQAWVYGADVVDEAERLCEVEGLGGEAKTVGEDTR